MVCAEGSAKKGVMVRGWISKTSSWNRTMTGGKAKQICETAVAQMIGKPAWQSMDVLPSSEEDCYQHPFKTGTSPLCK